MQSSGNPKGGRAVQTTVPKPSERREGARPTPLARASRHAGAGVWPWILASTLVHAGVAAPFVLHRSLAEASRASDGGGALVGEAVALEEGVEVGRVDEIDEPGANTDDGVAAPQVHDEGLGVHAASSARPRPKGVRRAPLGHAGTEEATPSPPPLFGAVGERGAIDVATAFTRGFPQAASADPVWASAPFGEGGSATVTLEIDATGELQATRIGGSPGPGLRRGIERTLALLKNRSFTAPGRVTTLRVHARVSPDEVHDGLHGDVFALGASYREGDGSAFFALAIGRRVDVNVRAGK